VSWIADGNGVHFGRHGTILSLDKFKAAAAHEANHFSVEVWFEPDRPDSGTLLAFYVPGRPRQFWLAQSKSYLSLRTVLYDGIYGSARTRLYVEGIFHPGERKFVTVTSDGGLTSIYVDGALKRTSSQFLLSGKDLEGELIVANLFTAGGSWSGVLRGLAFYLQDLTPGQVHRHFETWTTKGRPEISKDEQAVALYLFNEQKGRVIQNHIPLGVDLYIPERYVVVDQAFLTPFWQEFRPTWGYLNDVLVNIGGFVPFGFFCCAYLSLAGRMKKPWLVTILLGFLVSLTIEVTQAFLPTRGSGTTDLITNTFGTCCGVWFYRITPWRILAAKTTERM
jgi:VanZ family protein